MPARRALLTIALLVPAASAADLPKPDYSDPKATYRTYIEAVRREDRKAAADCWVTDKKDGAVEVMVGVWVSARKLNRVAAEKLGKDGLKEALKGWWRDDLTDKALDLTRKRADGAEVKVKGDAAELVIRWEKDDGVYNPVFEFVTEPRPFRKVTAGWKLDADKMLGPEREEFLRSGSWGRMFKDQVVILDEAVDGIEKGRLKSVKALGAFVEQRVEALRAKYDAEKKKP